MKGIILILVMLLLPLATSALATDQDPSQIHHLQFSQTSAATSVSIPDQPATNLELLDQVSNLFDSERGLAISDTASILLLCNQTNPLDDPDAPSELLSNLSVGLKFKF